MPGPEFTHNLLVRRSCLDKKNWRGVIAARKRLVLARKRACLYRQVMDISGEHFIPLAREAVWKALNDEAILREAIPGCETLTRLDERTLEATVRIKVGVVRIRLKGQVVLSDIIEPESYVITGGGKGATGFAKGSARVTLRDQDDGTLLSYKVDASLGGKLAQLGARLMQSAARKLANEFFETLSAAASGEQPVSSPTDDRLLRPETGTAPPPTAQLSGLSPWIWGPVVAAILLASLYWFAN